MSTIQHTLEDRYFERMNSAISDKSRLLQFLPQGNLTLIADMGAGDGTLSRLMQTYTNGTIHSIDVNPDALSHAKKHHRVHTELGDFSILERRVTREFFDAIVCSSVLHEVYSRGGESLAVKKAAWVNAIAASLHALKPGGVLIIRDGVAPEDPLVEALLVARTDQDRALVERYISALPQASGRMLFRDPEKPSIWRGTAVAVAEAMLTLNWIDADNVDEAQFAREVEERYMLDTEEGYIDDVLEVANQEGVKLNIIDGESYTQDGYISALEPRFGAAIADHHENTELFRPWFPKTNAIWVFERPTNS